VVGKKIQVIGPMSSGKSTTGRRLAERLGLVFIDLDTLRHGPNWINRPDDEFKADVFTAMRKATEGWVVAGDYFTSLGTSVLSQVDTVIWLRIPFRSTFPRLFWRTFRRAWTQEELWNGNRESWRLAFLSRESPLIEALMKARTRHQRERSMLEQLSHSPAIIELSTYRAIDRLLESLSN
jgi:adenylate kinase family enzyme